MLGRKPMIAAALCVVAIVACSSNLVAADDADWPMLEFDYQGQHITVPYMDKQITPVTAERKALEMEVTQTFKGIMSETAYAAFYEQKQLGLAKHVKGAATALLEARCKYQLLPDSGKLPALTLEFNQRIGDMWDNIKQHGDEAWAMEQLQTGKRKAKWSAEEASKVIQQLNNFSDLARAVVDKSVTGLYVDWSKLTIDGTDIGEWAGPIVTYCRRNRFRLAMFAADRMVNVIKSMDWNGNNVSPLIKLPASAVQKFLKCSYQRQDGSMGRATVDAIMRERAAAAAQMAQQVA